MRKAFIATVTSSCLVICGVSSVYAQIYNWQTGLVIPGTESISPRPSVNLSYWNTDVHNLRYANLSGGLDLHGSSFSYSWLDNARFTGANLDGAGFAAATLTDADLTGAVVTGANFSRVYNSSTGTYVGTGLSAAQLYSTASYQSGDLQRVALGYLDLTGVTLAGINLAGMGAVASDLTNADLSNANLTKARMHGVTLANADLTNANVQGARFDRIRNSSTGAYTGTGITVAQLYSTANYKGCCDLNLQEIGLTYGDLAGVNLAGKDAGRAVFTGAILTDADLSQANLSQAGFSAAAMTNANLNQANASGAGFGGAALTNANLRQANLNDATFREAVLTNADLSDAQIQGADFSRFPENETTYRGTGLSIDQLQSTANYKSGSLHAIGLDYNVLQGVNLVGMDLTGASFQDAELNSADLNGANLSTVNFSRATLVDVNFADADIRGASFESTTALGFSSNQFYSTASYRGGDLRGIRLASNDLTGWRFAGKYLLDANLAWTTLRYADLSQAILGGASFDRADLTNADLSQADLCNASFHIAKLARANLSGADTRGALYLASELSTVTTNLIRSDGTIKGLNLVGEHTLLVRDYDGDVIRSIAPIPIMIQSDMVMDGGGRLKMVFEDDPWNSTISFAPGIPVMLGGTLELTFASDVNAGDQIGRTFDLFDWTGVAPTGQFNVVSAHEWDLTNLYSTGEITLLTPEPTSLMLLAWAGLFVRRRARQ